MYKVYVTLMVHICLAQHPFPILQTLDGLLLAMFSHKTSQTCMANRKINFINVTKFGELTDDYGLQRRM